MNYIVSKYNIYQKSYNSLSNIEGYAQCQ